VRASIPGGGGGGGIIIHGRTNESDEKREELLDQHNEVSYRLVLSHLEILRHGKDLIFYN
jgi:hypothetical protein